MMHGDDVLRCKLVLERSNPRVFLRIEGLRERLSSHNIRFAQSWTSFAMGDC